MKVSLAYGQGVLDVEFPDGRTQVIEPAHRAGLPDEKGALFNALAHPMGAAPLANALRPGAPRRPSASKNSIDILPRRS